MNKLTRSGALVIGTLLVLAATPLRSEEPSADSLETAFVSGGQITLHLSAGGHRISKSPDNNIRVRWIVENESRHDEVKARADVDGSKATIKVDGVGNNFRTVIEVPAHSDLTVRLTAGELSIAQIVGNKDIRLRAGDLSVDVGDAKGYGHVEGSIWAGDIDAGPFNVQSGGLFRSIDWTGDGEHELRFHLYAGDVTLHRAKQED